MKLIIDGAAYSVTGMPSIGERTVRIPLAEAPPSVGTSLTLTADDGACLQGWTSKDWLRHYMDGTTLMLTQEPEPIPAPTPTPQSDPIGDLEAVTAELVDRIVNLELK